MRDIVPQRHFTMMCVNDGLTQGKPQPKAAAVVSNRVAPGKEHFEDAFFQCVRDTGTIIADADFNRPFSLRRCDPDG